MAETQIVSQPMDILDYPTLMTYSRILTAAPAGPAVQRVIDRFHELEAHAPDAGQMILQCIQYETYRALTADAQAMVLCNTANGKLKAALHGAEVLEELREGTACYMPTGELYELSASSPTLCHMWCEEAKTEEQMESMVFVTMSAVMSQTHDFPLALEVTQYFVSYHLAIALEKLSERDPRAETARTVKLAKYAIPWQRQRSSAYICVRNGEVFLLDGDMDEGTCEDYLNAIHQAEQVIPHEDLKRYLMDRIAAPCFDFALEEAVKLWLGDEKKQRGRPVEPSDVRESFDD